jgi:hypothetical protein
MDLIGWITTVFRIIDEGAMNAVVSSNLNQCKNQVQHMEWEGQKDEQSPNGSILEFPIRQVENLYNTVQPPVGNIVVLYLSPKLGQGRWGCPFHGRALCW